MEPGCSISTITGSDKRRLLGHPLSTLSAIAAKVAAEARAATVTEVGGNCAGPLSANAWM